MADKSAHACPRSPGAITGLAVGVTAALLIAGCSGSSDDGTSSSPTASGTAASAPAASGSATPSATPSSTPSATPSSTPSGTASTTDPARTTARGNIDQTIAPVVVPTRPPVALNRTVVVGSVRVSLVGVRSVRAAAQGPGEVAGPALAVTVRLVNTSANPLDVGSTVVQVLDSAGQVATPTTAAPSRPVTGRLKAGAQIQGTYVVTVAANRRSPIDVYVSYSTGSPVVHFRGEAA